MAILDFIAYFSSISSYRRDVPVFFFDAQQAKETVSGSGEELLRDAWHEFYEASHYAKMPM